jgi:hypothetical protein
MAPHTPGEQGYSGGARGWNDYVTGSVVWASLAANTSPHAGYGVAAGCSSGVAPSMYATDWEQP